MLIMENGLSDFLDVKKDQILTFEFPALDKLSSWISRNRTN